SVCGRVDNFTGASRAREQGVQGAKADAGEAVLVLARRPSGPSLDPPGTPAVLGARHSHRTRLLLLPAPLDTLAPPRRPPVAQPGSAGCAGSRRTPPVHNLPPVAQHPLLAFPDLPSSYWGADQPAVPGFSRRGTSARRSRSARPSAGHRQQAA